MGAGAVTSCEYTKALSIAFLVATIIRTVISCQDGQIYADPNNCANYIQCDHNTEIVRPCPPGLNFNPAIDNCDWPANVQCNSGGGSGGNVPTTTSTTMPPPPPPPPTSTSTPPPPPPQPVTGGTTPTKATKPPATAPPPTPSQGTSPSSYVRFTPYFDVNMNGPSVTQIYSATGQKDFTLAFALGSSEGCVPKWGGTNDINDPTIISPIKQLQALGGQFIVATGGAMGPYFEQLCATSDQLAQAYKIVLDAVGTNHLDVDVEATIDNDKVNQALAKVQKDRPNTTVSYTLMVQAEDYGLTPALGVDVLKNAKANGVQVTIVNPMTMEFGGPSADFGDSVINAAKSTLGQMQQIWPEKSSQQLNRMLGVTPMIGKNFNGKIFTQAHATKLVNWANTNQIGHLAFWSADRDNGGCPGGAISPTCSSISQAQYEFTKIFQQFKQ